MNRFLLLEPFKTGSTYFLSEDESHHLKNVLRLEKNAEITLLDGKGTVGIARVVGMGKRCQIDVQTTSMHPSSSKICLAFGISKPNALDFIFHRATEVGVHSFQPLITQHSISHWNQVRWEKIVRETCKQCEENVFPLVEPPVTLANWLTDRGPLFYCDETQRQAPTPLKSDSSSVSLLIGPEGGFAKEEIELIKNKEGIPLGLGANRLRTETAALVALTLLKKVVCEIL